MGIARDLVAHRPEPETLRGGKARIAQPAVVVNQRLADRAFKEQLAIVGPGDGLLQDRQSAVPIQKLFKGIEGLAAHGGSCMRRGKSGIRGGDASEIRTLFLRYHLPGRVRYVHRTVTVKGKGAAFWMPLRPILMGQTKRYGMERWQMR